MLSVQCLQSLRISANYRSAAAGARATFANSGSPNTARKAATKPFSTTSAVAQVKQQPPPGSKSRIRTPNNNNPKDGSTASNSRRRTPAPPQPPLTPGSPEYQKAYNSAARKWTLALIAMPIFLVTSYYLYGRLVLGHEAKAFPRAGGETPKEESSVTETT